MNQYSNDCKETWRIINEISNGKSKQTKINNIQAEKLITTDREKAEAFNEYFTRVGLDMAEKIIDPLLPSDFSEDDSISSSIFLRPVDEGELIHIISKLKNNSTSGPDGVSSKMIKSTHVYLLKPLMHIINLIFSQGVIPHDSRL